MGRGKADTQKKGFWNFIDDIEGDKVVWIIVFLLMIASVLAIFSSTSLLPVEATADRIDTIRQHIIVVIAGLLLIIGLYKVPKIGWFRLFSQFGFLVSFILLALLDAHVKWGFVNAQYINGAWRTLELFGFQLHVFEVVKVAMVMYLAWAMSAYKQDQEDIARRKKSTTLSFANFMATSKTFAFMGNPFWKRMLYMYMPTLIVCVMTMLGSNSSALFIGLILLATMLIGGVPFKEIGIALAIGVIGIGMLVGIHKATDGDFIPRLGTAISRVNADYDTDELHQLKPNSKEFYAALDDIRQPYSAKIAVHEGRLIGKGSGNSTQKYVVTNIYGDYMFSFLIEEYGLLIGGILVILLYVSLLARGSMIARLCSNEFAKITVGGLTVLITGQAFMHMLVNVDIGPMTGQTLPLISHGACAFLVFCIAFGVILSISRMARQKIREEEEAAAPLYESEKDDIQVSMDVLEQLDNLE